MAIGVALIDSYMRSSRWNSSKSALASVTATVLVIRQDRESWASISAVRTDLTAHPVPSGRVSACQVDLKPVSGFEPLTVRLQGQSR